MDFAATMAFTLLVAALLVMSYLLITATRDLHQALAAPLEAIETEDGKTVAAKEHAATEASAARSSWATSEAHRVLPPSAADTPPQAVTRKTTLARPITDILLLGEDL